ncbi:MAG: sulfatase [Planctomycetes bacterium]|nr:sulfatase [Planctomycetota bacterium]
MLFKRSILSSVDYILLALLLISPLVAADKKPPNILLAIGDDISWKHFGCYGSDFIKTPHFDALAKQGVKFMNAYCSAPGCSPSRAALLTGRHIWEIEEAGTHASNFPAHLTVYTEELEKSGYFTGYTGKPWSPGNYAINGRKQNPAGPAYNKRKVKQDELPGKGMSRSNYAANFEDFIKANSDNKPFCFWFGAHEAHRKFEYKSGVKNGKKLKDAIVPGFLPDNEVIRHDMMDYAIEIEYFDKHLGDMISFLKEIGEYDNTVIIVTADNGMAFPRAKANNYEYGVRMPLIISWPQSVPGDRTVTDFVSLIDLAPTFMEIAGSNVPEIMSGKSLMPQLKSQESGLLDASRSYALTGRERHTHAREENFTYPIRAMHTARFNYIRNLKPERSPVGIELKDVDGCPTHEYMTQNRADQLSKIAYGQRPKEELYDKINDPYCLNNLASNPEYRPLMDDMWKQIQEDLKEAGDPRFCGYGDIWESYPRYSFTRKYPGFNKSKCYNPEYVKRALKQMKAAGIKNDAYESRAKKF